MKLLFSWLAVVVIFLVLLMIMSCPLLVLAQEIIIPEGSNYYDLTPEQRKELDVLIGEIQNTIRRELEPEAVKKDQPAPRNVLVHIKGRGGKEFNLEAEREVEAFAKAEAKRLEPEIKKGAQKYIESTKELVAKITAKGEVPICPTDEVIIEPLGMNAPYLQSAILHDLLFLPKKLIPNDPDKAFGNVGFTEVDEGNVVYLLEATKLLNVDCFPSRVRATTEKVYHYTGLEALKNYDEKPEGVLDEEVKTLWEDFNYRRAQGDNDFSVR